MSFPNATIPFKPFKIDTPQSSLDDLKTHLRLSPLGPSTYENTTSHKDGKNHGVTMEWMKSTKAAWEEYDWREEEKKLNELPHYMAEIEHSLDETKPTTHDIHFIGIWNANPKAIPLLLLHGWPGCFLEFVHLIPHLTKSSNIPLHIIIPSLPGYAYSSPPPIDRNFTILETAGIMDKLMRGLGFESGYVAQGGDIGSFLSRLLGSSFESCKAVHLNFASLPDPPPNASELEITSKEKTGQAKGKEFVATGRGYANMHATRPATIGFCVASSPVALMAWVGEKILEWTDTTPSLSIILPWLTLYYLTSTFPTSIYPYRESSVGSGKTASYTHDPEATQRVKNGGEPKGNYIDKPMGFSWFPMELMPQPKSWIEQTGRLVHFQAHEKGGHFAATEQPELLAKDILDFLEIAWPKRSNL